MISHPTIFHAAVRRFIPGALAFLGSGPYLTARIKGVTIGPEQAAGFAKLTLFMTLGFVATVTAMRRIFPLDVYRCSRCKRVEFFDLDESLPSR